MKKKVLELFSTPVYLDSVPPDFKYLLDFFDSQEMAKDMDVINFGNRSLNTYILSDKKCISFSNYILKLITDFGKMLGYEYKNYKITQSWLSWKYPNEQHTLHNHANSLISGVFYYGNFMPKTPSIRFHKYVEHSGLTLKPKHKPNPNYLFSYNEFDLKISPGMIVLFPSNLIHSVPINKTNSIRKSLAFNAVPKKGFGEDIGLTELKF
jgi:hypothetical protein